MKKEKFSIRSRIKSFGFAWSGLKNLIKEEHNFRIHLIAIVVVLCLSVVLKLTLMEGIAILVAIVMVLSMEIINTCIENICDLVSKEYHPKIKTIKDMSAALVLISSILAVIIGSIVFLPKIF